MAYIPPNPNGQATKANSAPMTLASDSDPLPLSTGASTSALQTTGNASLVNIDTSTAAIGAKTDNKSTSTDTTAVSLIALLKEISFMEQNPASRAVTNAGTFAVQSTLQAGTAVIGKFGIDQTTPGTTNAIQATNLPATVDTNVGAAGSSTPRFVLANGAGRTLLSTGGTASASGNNTLIAAGTNRLKVYALAISTTSAVAVTCIFQSGVSGTELWRYVLQAPASVSTGANLVIQPPAWLFATAGATLLNLNLSGAIAVQWSIAYFDEA